MNDMAAKHYPHCRMRTQIDGSECPRCSSLDAGIKAGCDKTNLEAKLAKLVEAADRFQRGIAGIEHKCMGEESSTRLAELRTVLISIKNSQEGAK